MKLNRRQIVQTTAALSLTPAFAGLARAQDAVDPLSIDREVPSGGEDTVDLAELLTNDDVDDVPMGDPSAPVVIVDYSSMTCPHCANFHSNALPVIKEEYIDQGHVYYIFRDFPLDARARAAAMLARCSDDAMYHDVVDILFERQRTWATSQQPAQALFDIVSQAGFTQETFNACLTNRDLELAVVAMAERGSRDFGVRSTPTIFINGASFPGARDADAYREIIDPLIG